MPNHQEVNGTSLYINFESNKYRCFGKCCETGTIIDLLLKMGEQVDFNDIFSFEEQKVEPILLNDLFGVPVEDEFNRAASHVDGALSILTGIAGNQSIASGQAIQVADLVEY